jgi:hypothetical protein
VPAPAAGRAATPPEPNLVTRRVPVQLWEARRKTRPEHTPDWRLPRPERRRQSKQEFARAPWIMPLRPRPAGQEPPPFRALTPAIRSQAVEPLRSDFLVRLSNLAQSARQGRSRHVLNSAQSSKPADRGLQPLLRARSIGCTGAIKSCGAMTNSTRLRLQRAEAALVAGSGNASGAAVATWICRWRMTSSMVMIGK